MSTTYTSPVTRSEVATLSSRRFTKDNGRPCVLSAEVSDLPGGSSYIFTRLFADREPVGFKLKSARTGRTVIFQLADEIRDPEGDIVLWRFRPMEPNTGVLYVDIFND